MGYDLKTGYILRGNGKDKELELFGRKQQWYAELLGFAVAFIMMAFFANNYFGQEMFAPVSKTYVSTIAAGTTPEIAKWLLIWAVPGAIIQWVFGHRQVGILFATGILVGNTLNGLTILLALLLRYILEKRNEENRQILTIPRCRRSCRICAVQLLYRDARSCQEEIVSLSKQLFRRFSPMRCGMVEEIYDFSDHTAPSQKPKFSLGGLLE